MFPSPYLMFTIQLVVHICWKKYLLELQEAISREACVSMQSWGKLWVSQNHSSLFDVPRKTQNGMMCRANCKMAWCGAQIISGHYSAHIPSFPRPRPREKHTRIIESKTETTIVHLAIQPCSKKRTNVNDLIDEKYKKVQSDLWHREPEYTANVPKFICKLHMWGYPDS